MDNNVDNGYNPSSDAYDPVSNYRIRRGDVESAGWRYMKVFLRMKDQFSADLPEDELHRMVWRVAHWCDSNPKNTAEFSSRLAFVSELLRQKDNDISRLFHACREGSRTFIHGCSGSNNYQMFLHLTESAVVSVYRTHPNSANVTFSKCSIDKLWYGSLREFCDRHTFRCRNGDIKESIETTSTQIRTRTARVRRR